MTTCKGKTKAGPRCRVSGDRVGDDGYCVWHSPNRKDEAFAIRSKGGRSNKGTTYSRPVPPLKTISDAVKVSSWVVEQLSKGHLYDKRADVIIKAVRQFVQALEKKDLEGQLAVLKADLKALKRKR